MVELSSCKDGEERVGWLEAIVITARNDERRRCDLNYYLPLNAPLHLPMQVSMKRSITCKLPVSMKQLL
jgi:hypothetical protein